MCQIFPDDEFKMSRSAVTLNPEYLALVPWILYLYFLFLGDLF